VFLKKPRWVFADEATSALDPAAEQALYTKLLAHVQAVRGTLVSIAHRPAVAGFHTKQWTFTAQAGAALGVGAAGFTVQAAARSQTATPAAP
jgi:putative ATP-binding cassette transporter